MRKFPHTFFFWFRGYAEIFPNLFFLYLRYCRNFCTSFIWIFKVMRKFPHNILLFWSSSVCGNFRRNYHTSFNLLFKGMRKFPHTILLFWYSSVCGNFRRNYHTSFFLDIQGYSEFLHICRLCGIYHTSFICIFNPFILILKRMRKFPQKL